MSELLSSVSCVHGYKGLTKHCKSPLDNWLALRVLEWRELYSLLIYVYVHYTSFITVKFIKHLCMHTHTYFSFRELTVKHVNKKWDNIETNYIVKKGKFRKKKRRKEEIKMSQAILTPWLMRVKNLVSKRVKGVE